jgi:general secretion pathway protein I
MTLRARSEGFTLLEVLVALVILAIALGAVIKVSGQSAQALLQMRADTAATLMAEDLCARLQLAALAPDIGTQSRTVEIEGQRWPVQQTVEAGQIPGVLKVTYFVKTPAPFAGQASITTYFYPPPAAPTPPTNSMTNAQTPAIAAAQNPSIAP